MRVCQLLEGLGGGVLQLIACLVTLAGGDSDVVDRDSSGFAEAGELDFDLSM